VQLERELGKHQQQNIILQKQNEIDRLNAEADKKYFSRNGKLLKNWPPCKKKKKCKKKNKRGMPPVLLLPHRK